MDLEELKQAIVVGDKTKKPFTSRLSIERIEQLKLIAIILQAEKKLKARVSIEETLDNVVLFYFESKVQALDKPEKEHIAEPLQKESIAQETLQIASMEQAPEKPPLQVESKKQRLIGGMTKEEIEKEAKKAIPSITPTVQANSKGLHLVKSQEKYPNLLKTIFADGR